LYYSFRKASILLAALKTEEKMMNKRITINKALLAWSQYRLGNSMVMRHLDDQKLSFIFENIPQLNHREIEHLILCTDCLQKATVSSRQKESFVFAETAWRKAAATSEISWPQKIRTKSAHTIEIRESETDKNKGLIIVTINEKQRDQFEGKMISVVDGKGRVLLKGIVKDGEVFQRIENLDAIDLRLLVKTLDSDLNNISE
jgi:hypothetical protein